MKEDQNSNEPEVDIEPTGEDNFEEPLMEEIEESSQKKIKDLKAKLKGCEAEKQTHLDELQLAKADFLNAKKRLEEERLRDKERITNSYIERILPLCDSFSMAMSDQATWEAIDKEWRVGVESIHNQLKKILSDLSVSEVTPLNENFDPNLHEAMTEVPVKVKSQDQKVISVIQSGFVRKQGDKEIIIRPARVAVGVFQT